MLPLKSTNLAEIHQTSRYLLNNLGVSSDESAAHTRRICGLAHRLGRVMNLPQAEMIILRYGTMLHDVGKIEIPDGVLHKPGSLSPEECHLMRKHALLGAEIARIRRIPPEICSAILYHHERFDGTGYPYGLKGEEIPLPARIIAVVDSFDTIVNKRCYRQAQALEIGRSEIVRCAGTQFDPRIAEIFIGLLEVIAADGGRLAAA